ncbi:hypothetical protein LUZ60_007859 [Juncus effusus]|nr:hypothetical protein LUZ60_007859 [Juncus effusus]
MDESSSEKSWVKEVEKSLKDVSSTAEQEQWRKHCIYRVPSCIKELNSKAYRPQVVSFGPFHHGHEMLQPMEEHKHRALLHFLKRAKRPLEDFVRVVDEVVIQLQDSYQNLDEHWIKNKDSFVQLMIIDGCFMLELMSKLTGIVIVKSQSTPSIILPDDDYAPNDPIFSPHGMLYAVPFIRRDMLLLENQLPLLVLETLVVTATNSIKSTRNEDFINKLVLRCLAPQARALPPGVGLGFHPLDLYRKSLLQGPTPSPTRRHPPDSSSEIIRSAMELYEAGIGFRPSNTTSLRDIKFNHGVLMIPSVVVDDTTEFMFLNLMAFERLHVGAGHEVTSYVFFMDNIIDSAKDVSLLSAKGIIQNAVGSDKAVAKLFNSLSKDVVLEPESNLDAVQRMVNSYYKQPWNMWRANLCHTYFRSPWAFLSLVAAIFLLVMTVLQTVYTVFPYYENKAANNAPPAAPSPQ